jgi:uncharacterized protein (DUF433 family)
MVVGMDMDKTDRIHIDPGILAGKPVVRGTRISVEHVVDLLAQGWSVDQVVASYPGLTRDDVQACLAYAVEPLESEKVFPIPS